MDVEFLANGFSVSIEIIMWFLSSFIFFNVVHHNNWFVYIEPSLWPWDDSSLVRCMIFFMCYWTEFANILLRHFASIFIKDIGYNTLARMVKNLPAMRETQVRSLGWEDPLEKGMATHSSCLENSMDREAWQAAIHGVTKSQTRLSDFHFNIRDLRTSKFGIYAGSWN